MEVYGCPLLLHLDIFQSGNTMTAVYFGICLNRYLVVEYIKINIKFSTFCGTP